MAVLTVITVLGSVSVAAGATLNVPGSYTSISNAVNAAADGDTIQIVTNVWTECGIVISNKSLTIQGQGMTNTILQGSTVRSNASGRIFYVPAPSSKAVLFKDMTIRYGFVSNATVFALAGAAIRNDSATVTVQNCSITMNDAFLTNNAYGGGAFALVNAGAFLVISNCIVSSNTVKGTGYGGALRVSNGSFLIDSSTFIANSAPNNGGAVYLMAANFAAIRNSTFAFNRSSAGGGVLYSQSTNVTATVYNCTMYSNTAPTGADVYSGGLIDISSSIMAGNISNEFYNMAPITISNCLVQGTGSGSPTWKGVNITNQSPRLLPLAYNGGPTPTFALQSNSPCINAGANALGLTYDQRGSGFSRVRGAAADIGAYEFGAGASLSYSSTMFTEAAPYNTGAIDNSSNLVITLTGDTFTGADGDDLVVTGKVFFSNLPVGLTVSVIRTNGGAAVVVQLSGAATLNAAINSVTNLGFAFQDSAFTLGYASQVGNASRADLTVLFLDPAVTAPVVSNGGASAVGTTSATFNGYLTSTGGAPTQVQVYWGPADGGTNAAAWTNVFNLGVAGVGAFSATITNLTPNTCYYYRSWASNVAGAAWAPASTNFTTAQMVYTWDGSTTNWNIAAHWGGTLPGAGDIGVVNSGAVQMNTALAGSPTIQINSGGVAKATASIAVTNLVLNGGKLWINGFSTVLGGTLNVQADSWFQFDTGGTPQGYSGILSGSGALSITNTGGGTFNGANYFNNGASTGYTGNVHIYGQSAYHVRLDNDGALGSNNTIYVESRGSLAINFNNSYRPVTLNGGTLALVVNCYTYGTITATAPSFILGHYGMQGVYGQIVSPYLLNLSLTGGPNNGLRIKNATNATTWTGGMDIATNWVYVECPGSQGAGPVNIRSGAQLNSGPSTPFDFTSANAFTNDLSGNGVFDMRSADWGSTRRNLQLKGNTIAPGGAGAVGTLTINAATLALTNNGGNPATLNIEVSSGANYDVLNYAPDPAFGAPWKLTLAGAALQVSLLPGATFPNPNAKLYIVRNAGTQTVAIAGTFAGLPEGATISLGGGTNCQITYAADFDGDGKSNDVALYNFTGPVGISAVDNNGGASNITATSATLNGNLTSNGGDSNTTVCICWGPSDGGSSAVAWTNVLNLGVTGVGAFSATITNLTPNTCYYHRCWASNAAGVAWAAASTNFQTLAMYTITSTAGANGSIAPNGVVSVVQGNGTNFVVTPGAHYHVSDVVVDGASVGTTNVWSFANVTSNHAIDAQFAIDQYTLTVVSQHGTPTPAAGLWAIAYGTALTNTVTASEIAGMTQYVCTGWTSAGCDPATGSANGLVMTLTNDATLAWQWKTQFLLTVSAGANGSVTGAGGWYDSGSVTSVTAVASNGYWFAGWTGDVSPANTNDNPLIVTLDQARSITATFISLASVPVVDNDGGAMAVGATAATLNGNLSSDGGATAAVRIYWGPTDGGTVDIAWSNSCDFGVTGVGAFSTNLQFLIPNATYYYRCWASNAAGVAWAAASTNFQTLAVYTITATAGANGSIAPSGIVSVAQGDGTNFVITPNAHYHVSDVVVDGTSVGATNAWTCTNVTTNHTIDAQFAMDQYSLTIVSQHGTPVPPSGISTNAYGTVLSNSVTLTELVGTSQYVCVGWIMTGCDPGTGTLNVMTMTVTNDAVLEWEWTTNAVAPPNVDNASGASSVASDAAILNGTLTVTGGMPTAVAIYWGPTDGGTSKGTWATVTNFGVRSIGSFSATVSGLASNTPYYYRCWASNAVGETWAISSTNFTTLYAPAVEVWAAPTSGAWSVGANWVDHTAPLAVSAACELLFGGAWNDPTYVSSNDLGTVWLNRLVFTNGTAGMTNTLKGSTLEFHNANAAIEQGGAGSFAVSNAVNLTADLAFRGSGTGTVVMSGNIAGAGGITKQGANTLVSQGSNSFAGPLVVDGAGGVLRVENQRGFSTNMVVVSNGTLRTTAAMTVGNTGCRQVVITGSASSWTNDTSLTIATNAQVTVQQGATISINALYMSGDGVKTTRLTVASGAYVCGRSPTYVGYGWNAGRAEVIITDTNTVWDNGITNGIYVGGTGTSTSNNLVRVDSGAVVTNVAWIRVGAGATVCHDNSLVVTNGGRLYSLGASAVGSASTALNNTAWVSGAGSLWDLGGAALTVGVVSCVNNQMTIDQGGAVDHVGSLTVTSSNCVNLLGGTLGVGVAAVSNGLFTVGDGIQAAYLNILASTGICTFANGILVRNNGVLRGNGTVSGGAAGIVLTNGATLEAGLNGAGTLTVAGSGLTFGDGSVYHCTMTNMSYGPGMGWDLLSLTGQLAVATGAVVTIKPDSLGLPPAGFSSNADYSVRIATFGSQSGLTPSQIVLDTSALQGGAVPWTVTNINNSLYLVYRGASAASADYTWAAPNSGLWTLPTNWVGNVAPPAGGDPAIAVEFGGASAYVATNDCTNGTGRFTLNRLVLSGSSTNAVTLAGSGLAFTNASERVDVTGTGFYDIQMPMRFATNAVFDGIGMGATVIVETNMTASGGLTKQGAWTLVLRGTNSFGGPILVDSPDGMLRVENSGPTATGLGPRDDLTVSSGTLYVTNAYYFGNSAASSGRRGLVTGAGSVWTNSTTFYLASAGATNVTLTIANGARLSAGMTYVGSASRFNSLIITNGGRLFTANGSTIGASTPANNTLLVTGEGSLWNAGGMFYVGGSSSGNVLRVENGGVVTNGWVQVGAGVVGPNSLIISNGGRMYLASTFAVGTGSSCSNVLLITGGSSLLVAPSASSVGGSATSVGNVLIIDNGALLTNTPIRVGSASSFNSLIVTNGGRLVTSIGIDSYVGDSIAATGNCAIVVGSNSLWNAMGRSLIVANGTSNTLNGLAIIAGGAITNVATVNVAAGAGSSNNSVVVDGGRLFATSLLITNGLPNSITLNGAALVVVTNLTIGASGQTVTFNGGTLGVRSLSMSNGVTFTVGDGTQAAMLDIIPGGTNILANGLTISTNATLTGGGRLQGATTVYGTFSPGRGGVGAITNQGDFTLAPSATTWVELAANTTAGSGWDLLVVSNGVLNVGGNLNVVLAGSYVPNGSDRFVVMTNFSAGVTGTFSSASALVYGSDRTTVLGSLHVTVSNKSVVLDGYVTGYTATPPVVDNDGGASNVTATAATLNGNLVSNGGDSNTAVRIYWGTADGGTADTNWPGSIQCSVFGVGPFSAIASNLTPSTVYFYRCWASNAAGVVWAAASTNFLTVSVNDVLTYGTTTFAETVANDGSVNGTTLTLAARQFNATQGEDLVAAGKVMVSNLPVG